MKTVDQPDQGVCDFRNSGEENNLESAGLQRREESGSLHIPSINLLAGKVKRVLTRFGVSEIKSSQLAVMVTNAKLDDSYVEALIDWIGEQATSRTIYNPAGLLVQMVCQLAPLPLPKGVKVPTLNDLQMGFEQKKKFVEEQLPQIIAIEERNLREARLDGDKERIQARLNILLAQQAKEGRNLVRGTAYLAEQGIEFAPELITGSTGLQQYSDGNINGKGGYLNAATY